MNNWQNNDGENINIVILDSGCNPHTNFLNQPKGKSILIKQDKIVIEDGCEDLLGHGTAIYGIIHKSLPKANIINIKIYDELFYLNNIEILYFALEYIYENIDCHILNMSFGISQISNLEYLKQKIDKIQKKGTFIISAFQNTGAISYPANFENVIGVDSDISIKNQYDFKYIENSVVNIRAKSIPQRLHWLDNKYIIDSGASYATAHITAIVAKIIQKNLNISLIELKNKLKILCKEKIIIKKSEPIKKPLFKINNAIVFPLNKEIHALIRYREMLDFEIVGIFSSKYLGYINKPVNNIIKNINDTSIIKNVESINWKENFDTLILGHTDKIENLIGKDITKNLILNCIKYNKNIFAFDNNYFEFFINNNGIKEKFYFTSVNEENINQETLGKLYNHNAPILGILGTDSNQAKFSLQLFLRKKFIENNYKVGQLGTEPSSLLFNFDESYPIGYNSNVSLKSEDSILTLNNIIHKIDMKSPDLIIVGSQSGSKPDYYYNIVNLNLRQFEFIMGTYPDAVILCISAFQSIEFIIQTVEYIKILCDADIIAIGLYPDNRNFSQANYSNLYSPIDEQTEMKIKNSIKENLKLNCYNLFTEKEKIYNEVIRYFTS